ncbi:hypothetical protein LIZ31_16865, partial [Eggerthella lenta]|nr:hypothetical protein [Eggerthella lenta]
MLDLIIKNGSIVNEDATINGDIAIKDGKIIAIGDSSYFADSIKTIDASGKLVVPGLVD